MAFKFHEQEFGLSDEGCQQFTFSDGELGPVTLNYTVYGDETSKHNVLFIMGLTTSMVAWASQAKHFAERPEQYRTCFVDNRGVGWSKDDSGRKRYTTQLMADDLKRLLTECLQWDSVHIVGVSMGGMIAQELALSLSSHNETCGATTATPTNTAGDHNDQRNYCGELGGCDVKSLSLLVTHAGGWRSIAPFRGIQLMLRGFRLKDRSNLADNLCGMLYSRVLLESTEEECVEKMEDLKQWHIRRMERIPMPSLRTVMAQMLAVLTHRLSPSRLSTLGNLHPTLLLTGDDDALVRPANTYYIKDCLGDRSILRDIKDCGHGIHIERAEWVCQQLQEWIGGEKYRSY